jgi:ATP-dependent DNA ligase
MTAFPLGGKHNTETKRKIGFSLLGRQPWNRGVNREMWELQKIASADVIKRSEVFPKKPVTEPQKDEVVEKIVRKIKVQLEKGIYLVYPHGELAWKGLKKGIVKSVKFEEKEPLLLVSRDADGNPLAYGIIKIGEPKPISLKEFEEMRPLHRITEEEFKENDRKYNWSKKQLYYYPITFLKKFKEPKKVKLPQGIQTFIREVQFLKLKTVRKDINPSELSDTDLIFVHAKMHEFFADRPHNWSVEDVVNLHVLVVQEMKRRGMQHKPVDKLDDLSKPFLVELIKDVKTYDPSKLDDRVLLDDHRIVHTWFASIEAGKELRHPDGSKITLEEVRRLHDMIVDEMKKRGFKHESELAKVPERVNKILDKLEDATIIENFVSMIGSYVTDKEKPNDVDFLLRFDRTSPEFIERAVKVRIAKMLDSDEIPEIHFTNDPEGPHDDFVPVYDLVLRRRKPELVEMEKKEKIPPERYYEEFAVKPGQPYLPQKPFGSAFYEIDKLKEALDPETTYSVEKKLNGFHATLHKWGNQVKIFSEQKKDLTVAFPTTVEALKQLSDKSFIIDGELVPERGGRRALAPFIGAAKRGVEADDSGIKVYVWDIIYYDGKDISKEPLEVRKEVLKKLKFSKKIVNTPYVFVKGIDNVIKAVKAAAKLPGSEGAVIKDISKPYHFGKESKVWIKFRNLSDLHVIILKVNKKDQGWNYTVGIKVTEEEKKKLNPKYLEDSILRLGNTFNTSEKFEAGEIIDILVEEVWRHISDAGKRYSIHKPRVKQLRPDLERTSTISDLDDLVSALGVEVRE